MNKREVISAVAERSVFEQIYGLLSLIKEKKNNKQSNLS